MKILVIRFSSMGDVILTTPLFSFLKKHYPDRASITFITGSEYAGLFADDPRLSETAGLDASAGEMPPHLLSTVWDMVVDCQNNGRSRALAGSVQTASLGFFDKRHWQRFMLLFLRCNRYDPVRHVAARYIQAAGGDRIPAPDGAAIEPLGLFFREDSRARMGQMIRGRFGGSDRPLLSLLPFSAWENKEWPSEYFVNVGRHFLTRGWNVAIVGGPTDTKRAEQMKERIGDRCQALAGDLSLYECGCLFSGCTSLALGNDTGLSHLARACGVKTGILYGPTTSHFGFYPYGEPPFRVFEERLICRPCHAHGGNICLRWFSRRCLRQLTTARVISGLEDLLNDA